MNHRTARLRSRAAALAASLLVLLAACSKNEPLPEPVRAVRTQAIDAESAADSREYAAEVRARTESRLSFRVGGKITKRAVDLGQHVKGGQLLVQLDPDDMRQSQDAAHAALAAAKANFELAAADFRRFKDLRDQGFISSAELERRETALKSAQAQLDQAQAQANVQRNQASYTTLSAAASGVITAVEAEVGAVVSPGMPVLRLAHDGPRDVVFSVPEDALATFRPLLGKRAALQVRLWGQQHSVAATLRELAAAADPSTRTYQAKADVGDAAAQLGQTAAVLFESPRREGVIKLPLHALAQWQGAAAVWVVDKATMSVRPHPVTVAGAEGNQALIAAGLQPGMQVVTAGVHALAPGQKVKFYRSELASATPSRALAPSPALPGTPAPAVTR
jgi:RND family efflux transporter MFP subunit